jgi:small subunit ribosomal protein S16
VAVRIRLKRTGRTNRPSYRIEAFESSRPRDGRSIESLGTYNPHGATDEQKLKINRELISKWLDRGALPTEKVASLLKKHGIYAKK